MRQEDMKIKDKILGNASESQVKVMRSLRDSYREIFDPFPYRRYMRKHNCVFIHIPKAAGTSVLKALGYSGARDHSTYREFLKASPTRFERYFKFTFVRNPYDRFLSLYKYLTHGGNKGVYDLKLQKMIADNEWSVDDFCSYVMCEKLFVYYPLFWPQSLYVCDYAGQVKVDFVGKLESIVDDFNYVSRKIGIKTSLQMLNKSKNVEILLKDSTKTMVYDIYKNDFINFSYAR